eukprot:TRINITY_DN32989_c0_g1_i2.p1 TRINITY_DN32989_c0_g1~~TRINITY_DN32989_c0_g1_i2.p1  ORF type:complete len:573 (-),score=57.61 TRINITY_DN32989_c0_g1_i2:445-2163(-)
MGRGQFKFKICNCHQNHREAFLQWQLRKTAWRGVKNPSWYDWLGVMLANSNPQELTPIKYKYASSDKDYIFYGSGKTKFQLLNHRYDLQVGFFQGGLSNPKLVARSEVIKVTNPNEPVQGHISMTNDLSEMLVQWVTKNSSNPIVKWGTQSGKYTESVSAKSVTYTRDQMCGAPATTVGYFDPGQMHYGIITGLNPNSKYYYVFGDPQYGFSEEYSFYSPPTPGPDQDVHILLIADVGQAEEDGSNEYREYWPSRNTTYWVSNQPEEYKLLVHNGDICYAQGYVSQWDNYYHQLVPVASKMPYMTSTGNHERDWPDTGDRFNVSYDSGGECGIPHYLRTLMPTGQIDTPWYSFDYGPVHFLQYSTEHPFRKGTPQHEFMVADLKGVNRSVTPWLVVGGHRPMYIDSAYYSVPTGDINVADALQEVFEDIFMEYKVDVTFHGHHHSYQRTCPVFKKECQGFDEDGVAKAPVYIVNGNGGAELTYTIDLITPEYFEMVDFFWGFTKLHVNATTFHMMSMSDDDGSVKDELILTKPLEWGTNFMEKKAVQFQPKPMITPFYKKEEFGLPRIAEQK